MLSPTLLTSTALTLAHAGEPVAPHDVAGAWDVDLLTVVVLVVALVLYRRGSGGAWDGRTKAFVVGLAVVVVAVVSPLDAMAGSLASAHMVQHVLLVLVAAPLVAWSAPVPRLLRGLPRGVVRGAFGAGRRLPSVGAVLAAPAVVWLLHVATLWVWHSSVAYGAALASEPVHLLEHATFVGTGVLVWRTVLGPARVRLEAGPAVLVVFGLALQGTLLAALMTFSTVAWYDAYAATTPAWGTTALADQQLAGVIMWVPASGVYVGVALTLLVTWVRSSNDPVVSTAAPPG